MSKRTPTEQQYWSVTRERLGQTLKDYYQACTTDELPPRLLAVLKGLDEDKPELSGDHVQ